MRKLLCLIAACIFYLISMGQVPFKSGNLVVSRIGNGNAPLTDKGEPVYLDEYTPNGVLVQSILLPTAINGSNNMLTLSATDIFAIGNLSLSPDNRFLSIVGFNATPGTSNSTLIDGTLTNKTIGIINYNGDINTSTVLTDAGDSHPFSAITSNGTDIWSCYAAGGLRYCQIGSNSSVSLTTSTNRRRVVIRNGQLYSSNGAGVVSRIGTGLPTTGSQIATVLTGISTGSVSHFVFADLNPAIPGDDVLYVANEGVPALQKYSLSGTTWVSNGQIGVDGDNYLSITAQVSGTTVTLYLIRGANFNSTGSGELVTLTDNTGYNPGPSSFVGTPTVIASAGSNMTFRGIAFAPTPPSVTVSVKTYLQGAFNVGLNRHKDVTIGWKDILNNNALSQPFNVAPFNYAGTESVAFGFFQSNAAPNNTDILDWVLLELHDATTPSTIIARKACFIREDGQVVDLDGSSNPTFTGVGANNYYIVLKHRNHLTIRSSSTVFVNGATPTTYDFTSAQAQAYQNGAIVTNPAMKDLKGDGTVFGMWGGNANMNTSVRASGAIGNNDYLYINNILLGGNTANILTPVYNSGDLNLDGQVRASGALTNNDYLILVNLILGGNTANIYTEHQ